MSVMIGIDPHKGSHAAAAVDAGEVALAELFGAIVAAREYTHGTAVPTFLIGPHRHRTMLAQLSAVLLAGGLLGFVGGALTVAAGAILLPMVDAELLLSAGTVARLATASALAGATGAVLGAAIGAVLRNTGGAVTATVLLLLIAPPIIGQLVSGSASWIPSTLIGVISGIEVQPGLATAIAALAAWGLSRQLSALAPCRDAMSFNWIPTSRKPDREMGNPARLSDRGV